MEQKTITELLDKVKDGTATPAEEAAVKAWLHQLNDNMPTNLSDEDLEQGRTAMWSAIQSATTPRTVRLWPRIAAAASIVLALGAGVYYFNRAVKQELVVAVKQDVAPGTYSATLQLANGRRIALNAAVKGELAKEAGVSITKAENGEVVYTVTGEGAADQFNTLSTAKGETYKVNLPDGTQVWLNAASSLRYPARFAGNERKVTLTGEAYFEVAKDKAHPFKVNTGSQEIEVLGTHFDVNAYTDESAIRTTLLEGSVKINNAHILKPGEQALNAGNNIKISKVDTEKITDWKDGDFNFKGEDFRTAMRKIARWYDVIVVYDPAVPDDIEPGGRIARKNNLSAVLKRIESTGQVHFKVEGKRILVTISTKKQKQPSRPNDYLHRIPKSNPNCKTRPGHDYPNTL